MLHHVLIKYGMQEHIAYCEGGITVMELLKKENILFLFPCGGRKSCGNCIIYAECGVSPADTKERELLQKKSENATMRLACFAKIIGDCVITVPIEQNSVIETRTSAHHGFAFAPCYEMGYAIAVDIGTTTIACYLYSANSPDAIGAVSAMNAQRSCGGDVLSRIVCCNENGVAQLRDVIRNQLKELEKELCRNAGILLGDITALCITGNTAMLHILAGLEPRSLALSPFVMQSRFGKYFTELGQFFGCAVYLPSCISAFVGADTTCAILSTNLRQSVKPVLLVDIGTNGEMVLQKDGALLCCSAAAGPAFESGNISCGMPAAAGAVNRVFVRDNGLAYETIGGVKAAGICGSGLIDAIAAFRKLKLINKKGRIAGGKPIPLGDSGQWITQADINQLQMAKGAIRGGMNTLLHKAGATYHQLDQIIFCGGFGSYLNIESAAEIGLIPAEMCEKTRAVGNAAGAGAGLFLQCREAFAEEERIVANCKNVELAQSKFFTKEYLNMMYLP